MPTTIVPLVTDRLRMEPVSDDGEVADLQRVFNSNPAFIDASESGRKREYGPGEVGLYLWQEIEREDSTCLAIRQRDRGKLIGCAAVLTPNPDDHVPWIGLLILDARHQRRGFGFEAVEALERSLADGGWSNVRLNVLTALRDARRFWERLGYAVTAEQEDSDRRPVWLMEKRLSPVARGR